MPAIWRGSPRHFVTLYFVGAARKNITNTESGKFATIVFGAASCLCTPLETEITNEVLKDLTHSASEG